ncbi:MAG TPA: hypothetical protein VL486_06500 [Verrucomicrobiae bacterium]|nr:hypothetical protein [Verrucomicrobiae bacterium]
MPKRSDFDIGREFPPQTNFCHDCKSAITWTPHLSIAVVECPNCHAQWKVATRDTHTEDENGIPINEFYLGERYVPSEYKPVLSRYQYRKMKKEQQDQGKESI